MQAIQPIVLPGGSYLPKTQPWAKQRVALELSADADYFALFMEMRTGKSKVIIDKAAYQYENTKRIDALLVVAMPSGAPRNWEVQEIPDHLPDRIPRKILLWKASKASRASFKKECNELIKFKGLAILLVNGEAIITVPFRRFAVRFLKARKTFLVGDETTLIMKNPKAKRTRVMMGMRKFAVLASILDGTPVGEGPLDLYSQISFLSTKIFGFTSFYPFKMFYAKWEKGYNQVAEVKYDKLIEYQNLDILQQKLAPHSFQVMRKDCFDIPDLQYSPHYFELTKEQRRVYDDLRDEYEAELSGGVQVQALMVLTRYLRLQQVASNYWPPRDAYKVCPACKGEGKGCDACDEIGAIPTTIKARAIDPECNPRLDALKYQFNQSKGNPTIIWCRFQQDVTDAITLAQSVGRSPVRYDGLTDSDEKLRNLQLFQNGKASDFIGSPRAGGRSLKIIAPQHIFYSNEFSLLSRLQAEVRSEVDDGRTKGTVITDLIAADTIDETIVSALRKKKKIADIVMNRTGGTFL